MKIAAALEHEKIREEKENWNKIYLHKDGKFFRAYEWSAWLIKMFVCTEEFQRERGDEEAVYRSVNSFLGVLSHNRTYNIRRKMFLISEFLRIATLNDDITKMNKPHSINL